MVEANTKAKLTAHFESAIATSQGARRYQEDAAAVWSDPHAQPMMLAVLADGMGGHAGGAMASRLASDMFIAKFTDASGDTAHRLTTALDTANNAIARAVEKDQALSGMGSTIIAAAFGTSGLEWISVGDSPLYLYSLGEVALLNEDHSLAPALDQMATEGLITADAARNDPRRHMLRSAVTGEDLELVDLSRKPLTLEPGDYVILASDGVHTIDESKIAALVQAFADHGPQAVADALVRAVIAQHEPHQDNVTVLAVRFSPATGEDDAR
jgi:PPM family protein phosphatase